MPALRVQLFCGDIQVLNLFEHGYVLLFTAAPVLDVAAPTQKSAEVETGLAPTKAVNQLDSSSLASGMKLSTSPATSLRLSTSMDPENPEDTYILLDECVSGTSSMSPMMSTSSTPSPGNTLSSRNTAPVEYMNLDSSGDSKTIDPLPTGTLSSSVQTKSSSMDTVFEHEPTRARPASEHSIDDGIWDCQSTTAQSATSLEFAGHSKCGSSYPVLPLPAKTGGISDVEYDVPFSGAASHPAAPSGIRSSPAAPAPHHHMAVPGRMHRYVNAAPIIVRTAKSHGESPTASSVWPAFQTSTALPPKKHS